MVVTWALGLGLNVCPQPWPEGIHLGQAQVPMLQLICKNYQANSLQMGDHSTSVHALDALYIPT